MDKKSALELPQAVVVSEAQQGEPKIAGLRAAQHFLKAFLGDPPGFHAFLEFRFALGAQHDVALPSILAFLKDHEAITLERPQGMAERGSLDYQRFGQLGQGGWFVPAVME